MPCLDCIELGHRGPAPPPGGQNRDGTSGVFVSAPDASALVCSVEAVARHSVAFQKEVREKDRLCQGVRPGRRSRRKSLSAFLYRRIRFSA